MATDTLRLKLNREWHEANRMPKNPSFEDRVAWHVEHQKHCACREMPQSIRDFIDQKAK